MHGRLLATLAVGAVLSWLTIAAVDSRRAPGSEVAAVYRLDYAITADGHIYRYAGEHEAPPTYASPATPFEPAPGYWVLCDSTGSLSARPVALYLTPFGAAGRIYEIIAADGNHYRLTVAPRGGRGTGPLVPRPVELVGNVFAGGREATGH